MDSRWKHSIAGLKKDRAKGVVMRENYEQGHSKRNWTDGTMRIPDQHFGTD